MRPSIWSSYFIELSPEETVRTFSRCGWRELELSDEHARALLARGDPARAGREFAALAGGLGVSFPQGHLSLTCEIAPAGGGRLQDETIDDLRRWLDLFLALGVRAAVIHPGGEELVRLGAERARVHELRARALRALTAHVRGSGLVLCLENVSYAPSAAELLATIEAAGSAGLGICLDTGHLNMAGGDQAGFVEEAGARLLATHLADNEGASDQHLAPFGRGTVRWDDLMRALGRLRYQGLLNLEIPGENRCPVEVRLAKLDYLGRVLSYLKAVAARERDGGAGHSK